MWDPASIETCQSGSFLPPMLYSIWQLLHKVNIAYYNCFREIISACWWECQTTLIVQCVSIVSKTWFPLACFPDPACIWDLAWNRDPASIETCQSRSFLPPMLIIAYGSYCTRLTLLIELTASEKVINSCWQESAKSLLYYSAFP